jgi:hypothetical protein
MNQSLFFGCRYYTYYDSMISDKLNILSIFYENLIIVRQTHVRWSAASDPQASIKFLHVWQSAAYRQAKDVTMTLARNSHDFFFRQGESIHYWSRCYEQSLTGWESWRQICQTFVRHLSSDFAFTCMLDSSLRIHRFLGRLQQHP